MSDKFNIDNYNIDELLRITKLDRKVPLNVDKISKHIKTLIKNESAPS